MKVLVVYYSLSGNTRYIANKIAEAVGAETLEIRPKKNIKSTGFMRYMWGSRQVVMGDKPEMEPLNKNPGEYDFLFIGTPVWAGSFVPVFRTLFDFTQLKDKKIALFCCNMGAKGRVFEKLKNALEGNEIVGEIEFKEPIMDDSRKAAEVENWARKLVTKS